MSKFEKIPGFGPSDPTDNRFLLDWQSRYPPEARSEIAFEAWYLAVLLLLAPSLLVVLECRVPGPAWRLFEPYHRTLLVHYGLSWIAGTLGGTLFAIKWLYHVVARGLWNLDRRLWRLFTPHISGGLAFSVMVLLSSGTLRIFDQASTAKNSVAVGVGFLVGYFSDSAIAKLTEIADTLFGTTRSKEKHVPVLARGSEAHGVAAPDGESHAGQQSDGTE